MTRRPRPQRRRSRLRETLAHVRHQLWCRLTELGSFVPLRAMREIVLTLGAVLGVVCLLGAAAAVVLGIRPIVFESGSMAPSIQTGALAFSRTVPAADLRVGDVVTVPAGDGSRVTHRVTAVKHTGDEATLVLQGDANRTPDARTYTVSSAPRVLFDVPRAGYVVTYLSGPVGVFGAGVLVGLVALTFLRPGQRRDGRRSGHRQRVPVAAGLVLAVAAGTSVTAIHTTPTSAYYADTATASTGTFTADEDSAPGRLCTLRDGVLTFGWEPVTGATDYVLSLKLQGGLATVLHVAPGELATIDLRDLEAGVHVVTLTAVGDGPGISVSVSLGTVVVVKVGKLLTLGTALCLNLGIDLNLTLPSARGARRPATTDGVDVPTTPPGATPSPTPSPGPTPDPWPTTTPDPTPEPPVEEPTPTPDPTPEPPPATEDEGSSDPPASETHESVPIS